MLPKEAANQPRQHPMITRSKAQLHAASTLLCTILMLSGNLLANAINTRFPDELNVNKTILYATTCVSEGITIARESCMRPAWSTSCTFTNNWRTTISTIDSVLGSFNQLQLFDNNTLIVESLTISIQDYIDAYDFICVDHKGWIRRKARRITGTPRFCENHECHDNPQLFCIYDSPIALFITNQQEPLDAPPIIVRAWGTVMKPYYGYPDNTTTNRRESSTSPLVVSSQCSKGGLTVTSNMPLQVLEVCIANYCVFLKEVTSEFVLFPNSLIMYDYDVRLKALKNNHVVHEAHVECEAHPICETLQCRLCWEWIYNSHCWTILETLLVIIIPAAFVPFVPFLCLLLKIISSSSCLLIRPLRYYASRKPRGEAPLKKYINRRRRTQKPLISCIIMIFLQVHFSNECSQFTSITANEHVCTLLNNTKNCSLHQATMISLQPLQQEACLEVRDHQNEHMGIISITVHDIQYKCHKRIEFFLRDHEFTSESIHRCYMAGSCTENTCDNIKPTDILTEFSSFANNHPGYTSCSPTCGCLICAGCLLCHESCLFHRLYVKPTSTHIYTVFNCPSWDLSVTADVTLNHEDGTISNRVRLTPGNVVSWNHLRLTLISTITPYLPILGSTFMSNGNNITIIKPAYKGQMLPHTAGQFQCSTMKDAKDFNCHFTGETCKCTNGFRKMSCTCPDGSLKRLMEPSPLPKTGKNFLLMQSDDNVIAKLNIGTALQLHLVMDNLNLVSRQHKSTCTIQTSDLTDCCSCISGATVDLVCTSSEGEATALIHCPNQTQVAKCNTRGHLNKVILHFDTNNVLVSCIISCPGGSTDITIKGSLFYADDELIKQGLYVANHRTSSDNTQPEPFKTAIESISEFVSDATVFSPFLNFKMLRAVVLISVVILLFLILLRIYRCIITSGSVSKKHR